MSEKPNIVIILTDQQQADLSAVERAPCYVALSERRRGLTFPGIYVTFARVEAAIDKATQARPNWSSS